MLATDIPVDRKPALQLAETSAGRLLLCFWHQPCPLLLPFVGQGFQPTPLVTWLLLQQHLPQLLFVHG